MLYGNRTDVRQVFVDTFHKSARGETLSAMEQIIAQVIQDHPEYHAALRMGEISGDYTVERGETNPFLHMGMHITIREQVSIDRPSGIRSAWQALVLQHDAHKAEHLMLDSLAELLMQAQRDGTPPDEQAYLRAVRRLSKM
ncbi:MAG: DUF1841 family protein [Gammaproteobacteria bacterium]|nr:DUF1841 family protein [Gammaproteobacteria bacterium]